MAYIRLETMEHVPKKERIYEERIVLKLSNKTNKNNKLMIITYDLPTLDLFQDKCEIVFGKDVSNSIQPNGNGSVMFTITFTGNKEQTIIDSQNIASEMNLPIKIDKGTKDNIQHFLYPILLPVYIICYILDVLVVERIRNRRS